MQDAEGPQRSDRKGSTWTDERVELLKKLKAQGYTSSQIAAELGYVTRNAVIGKLERLGVKNVRFAPKPEPKKYKRPPRSVHNPQRAARLRSLHLISVAEEYPDYQTFDLKTPSPKRHRGLAPMWRNAGVTECKWPVGTKLYEDGFFCGADVERGSYCAEHGARAYNGQDRRHRFSTGGYSVKSSMWR